MTSFDVVFAILTSFSLNAWNACYINSYLFLTIVGCEKIGIVGYFSNMTSLWRLYDVISAMLASFFYHFMAFYNQNLKTFKSSRMEMANTYFKHFLGLKNLNFESFFKFDLIMISFDIIFAILTSFFKI